MSYRTGLGATAEELESELYRTLHEQAKRLYAAKHGGTPADVAQAQDDFNNAAGHYLAAGGVADQVEELQQQTSFVGQFEAVVSNVGKLALIGVGLYFLVPALLSRIGKK